MSRAFLWCAPVFVLACERDPVTANGRIFDAGGSFGRLDSGVDAGRIDSGVRDAGSRDASDLDAMPTDAEEPACECRPVPDRCPALETNRPAFTPPSGQALDELLGVLACADQSFRVAIYEFGWECIVDAIAARLEQHPDLHVQVLVDDEECPRVGGLLSCPLSRIDGNPRVAISFDDRSALMHHKFAIADDWLVWTGSANMIRRSFCTDWNDSIVIDEPEIVAAYGAEMDRLFRDRQFGPRPAEVPREGGVFSVHFGPQTPIASPARWFNDLVQEVSTASVSVDFAVSAWTRTELSDAMMAAHQRGVRVRGIVSPGYADEVPAHSLAVAGLGMRMGTVHAKLAIIDGKVVATGSPNWSAQSFENNEGSLWIRSSTIAAQYTAAFESWYAASTDL